MYSIIFNGNLYVYIYAYIHTYIYSRGGLVTQSCPTPATPWAVAHQAPWNFPGKNTRVGCHFLLQMCVCVYVCVYIYTHTLKYEISFFQKLENRILSIYQALYRETL